MKEDLKYAGHQLQAAFYWSVRNWDKLLPIVAVILMVVIFFGQRAIVNREHSAAVSTCERSNDARVANIHNLRGDVRTLKAELGLWEAVEAATTPAARAASPPLVAIAFAANVAAIRRGIGHKEHAIASSIAAQAPVAIAPGSPVVDCDLAT